MIKFIRYYVYYYYYLISLMIGKRKNPLLKYDIFALKAHHSIRQKYSDKYPYYYHLKMVRDSGMKFIHLISNNTQAIYAGLLLHDILEDVSSITYNDLKKIFGEEVADIVYCCSNEKGKNRYQRANNKFYNELRANEQAVFVKISDRIGNMTYSKQTGSSMFDKYKKEYPEFSKKLFIERYQPMFFFIENGIMSK